LQGADLRNANFEKAILRGANLNEANLQDTNLCGADLQEATLEGAYHLSFDQLSKVKTLFDAKLDEKLFIKLKERYPALFEVPD
jgi:uncharacterized protein YjbI with pentapeptide repeats